MKGSLSTYQTKPDTKMQFVMRVVPREQEKVGYTGSYSSKYILPRPTKRTLRDIHKHFGAGCHDIVVTFAALNK